MNFSSLGRNFKLKFEVSQNFELARFCCMFFFHAVRVDVMVYAALTV
jgi:hypothetical protein